MLLEFKIKNYKSFVDETTFSMVPASKQTGLDYSLLKENVGRKIQKDFVLRLSMVLMLLVKRILLVRWIL